MIWNLRLDEVLPGVGDEDLLEKDEINELEEIEWCRQSCSYDVYV